MMLLTYLWYLIRHKWFVLLECWKLGLYWQGLIHDNSKFLPDEFFPYARHFYSNVKKGRDETGYYKPTNTGDSAFDHAWFLHQKRNRHHWQWWVVPTVEDKTDIAVMVPLKYIDEMVADWRGAGRAQGTPDTIRWYLKNCNKMLLHPDTRRFVEIELGIRVAIPRPKSSRAGDPS